MDCFLNDRWPLIATLLLGMGLTVGALGNGGCLPTGPVEDEAAFESRNGGQKVLAAMALSKEVPLIHRTDGRIIPSNRIKIHAETSGLIAEVLVHEGQRITAGTTVLRYENEIAKVKLEFLNAEIEEAEAAIEYEQERFDNRDALLEDDEISTVVFDYLEKKLEYEKARVKRAKAEVVYLQKLVRHADVVSSIAGVVISRSIADGMPVAEGQFLMEIVQDDPVKLQVLLPEEFIPATHRGQLLQVRYPDATEEQMVKITDVGVAVDPLTNTFEVFAKLENPQGRLKAGMEMPITLVTDKKTRIVAIPKAAVTLRGRKPVVFRVQNGRAKRVIVRLGQTVGDDVAVVKGVAEGDILVVEPSSRLKNGDKVEILTATAEKPS